MANEDNDFLTSWAAQAPAPAADGGDTDAGNAGGDDEELGGEGGNQGGNTADNADDGHADDDASLPAGDDQHQEDRTVPLTALKSERQARKEEREKREAAERRVQELENQLKAPPQQRQQQQAQPEQRREAPPPVDFWENPVGFVQQQVDGVRQEYEARANQQQQAEFRRAENVMRRQHADFDEISQIVMEEAQRNPAIVPQIFQSEDPAHKLYELGKEIRDFRQFQTDPQSARARMKEELKAELLAELQGGNAVAAPAPAPSNNARRPVDLSNKRNAASASASAPPDQFNELFRRG